MKGPLAHCCSGDGRPVQSPSWVLCRECLTKLSEKMNSMRDLFDRRAAPNQEGE